MTPPAQSAASPLAALLLAQFPELCFAPARSAVTPSEIAGKWGCTPEHVFELLDKSAPALNLTGAGNKTSRQCIRIPVSGYYAETAARLSAEPAAPAPKPDPLDAYPELRIPATRGAISLAEIAEKWGCSPNHVSELVDLGDLATLDLTGKGNRTARQCLRVPVSSYYAATRARLRRAWHPPAKRDERQTEFGF